MDVSIDSRGGQEITQGAPGNDATVSVRITVILVSIVAIMECVLVNPTGEYGVTFAQDGFPDSSGMEWSTPEFAEEMSQLRESNPEYYKLLKALEILQSINTQTESPEQVWAKIVDAITYIHEIEDVWHTTLTNSSNSTFP